MSKSQAALSALRQRGVAPALTALLVQAAALLPVLACALTFPDFSTGLAAVLQAVLAAALARGVRQPRWWIVIHFLFPPLLLLAVALGLPSWLWGGAFVMLALVYWSTWRTRVPLFLSGQEAWLAVERLLPEHPARVVDIGSGLGGLVLHLAHRRPDCELVGIEIAPLPWLFSWLRARLAGSAARFTRGDYSHADLSAVDVVFAYLSPAAMPALWDSLRTRLKPGALLLSYEFPIPGLEPDLCIACGSRTLYAWRMPQNQQ
jgi:SAM-dependent methyltransferase